MRDKLGVLLMEEEDGSIAVQLFADPDKAKESFENLMGTQGQKPQRATFISLQYTAEGQLRTSTVTSKNLPVPLPPASEIPDGWRLGEGPVKIEDKGTGNG